MKRPNHVACVVGIVLLWLSSGGVRAQGGALSVAALLEQIGGADSEASERAIRELVRLDPRSFSEADIQGLVEAVDDQREAVRQIAVWRLLNVRDGKDKPVLDRLYDVEAKTIKKTKPSYPTEARRRGIRGRVELQFMVDRSGRVRNVRVLRSIPVLDEAAVQCIHEWEFKPALYKGRPAPFIMTESVKF